MITLSVDDQKNARDFIQFLLKKIDPQGSHYTAASAEEAFGIVNESFDIVFLDIEMPGTNGIDAAVNLREKYPRLNIIFVTGYPEYSLTAYKSYPVDFLVKPPSEADILRALKHLHYPVKNSRIKVQCSPFAIYYNDKIFDFKSAKTTELFAYLIFKNGVLCSNGELLGVLWSGNADKSGRLRQLVSDMRSGFAEMNAENLMIKKYGKVGIDMEHIELIGDPKSIADQFHFY